MMSQIHAIPRALNNLVTLNIVMVSTVGLCATVGLYLLTGPVAIVVTSVFAAVIFWFMFKKK